MKRERLHPLRLGVIALFVAVMIPEIASAQNEAPQHHRSSPSTYQVGLSLDLTVPAQASELHARTVSAIDRLELQRLQTKRRLERHRTKLRADRLTVRAPADTTSPSPVVYSGSSSGSVNWDAIASCESGGRWDLNTGNGFWGGLQFTPNTWFAHGGGAFDGVGPFPYSRSAQIAVAERVLAAQGMGAWPYCGRFG
jgi:hypothetical protein